MKKDTVQLYKLNCFFKNGGMIENRVFNSLLDLKNIQVYKSILFKNCMFSKTILLSNTQLEETIKFVDCTFKGDFIIGDDENNQTCTKTNQNIEFTNCIFHGQASFDGLLCLGSLVFSRSEFQKKASIKYANIANKLDIIDCIFHNSLDLNSTKVGLAIFIENPIFASTDGELDINAVIAQGFIVEGGFFKCNKIHGDISTKEYFTFTYYKLDKSVNSKEKLTLIDSKHSIAELAMDYGVALNQDYINILETNDFFLKFLYEDANIRNNGLFYIVKENDACYDLYKGTYIKNEKLDLSYSNFGKKIQINAVYIESPEILFDYVTCNHLDFVDSHFDSQSFFSMVSTEFLGDYRFQSCTIISGSLMCNGIKARNIFLQDVLFKMLKSTDDVNKSNIDFSFGKISNTFQMKDITFSSTEQNPYLNFCCTEVGFKFSIDNSFKIEKPIKVMILDINSSKFKNFVIKDVLTDSDTYVFNFNNFSFDVWYDACENETARWQQLVKRQTLQYFTRDIYVELEKYYRHKNNDTIADEIYYHGMYGTYLIKKNQWSIIRRTLDFFWRSFGYGLYPLRIFYIILMFITLGTIAVYYSQSYTYFSIMVLFKCIVQSIIAFIPFEGFTGLDIKSYTQNGFISLYMNIHKVFGYILVPLWIAGMTGIMKKK